MASVTTKNCPHCRAKQPASLMNCGNCGLYLHATNVKHNVSEGGDGTILLSDVKSSETDRISSGREWDVLFGVQVLMKPDKRKKHTELQCLASLLLRIPVETVGAVGVVRGSTNLIGGAPGAGKSTMVIEMAGGFADQTGKETLYVATEEQCEQIKARADRLGVKWQERIRMCPAMTGASPPVEELIDRYDPAAVFLDSLNGMAGDDLPMQIQICKMMKQCCSKNKAIGIILSHVNKGGEVAGLMGLQHEVDATFTFFPDEGEEDTPRILHVEKNRNGRAFIQLAFDMTATGLVLRGEPEDEQEEEDDDEDEDEDTGRKPRNNGRGPREENPF